MLLLEPRLEQKIKANLSLIMQSEIGVTPRTRGEKKKRIIIIDNDTLNFHVINQLIGGTSLQIKEV